jgi:hypothetical protein
MRIPLFNNNNIHLPKSQKNLGKEVNFGMKKQVKMMSFQDV